MSSGFVGVAPVDDCLMVNMRLSYTPSSKEAEAEGGRREGGRGKEGGRQ